MSNFFIDLVGTTDEARREFETGSKVLDMGVIVVGAET